MEKYGEVFTPDDIVKDMLDMIPEPETIERTYLEPSCGDGNFLVEILDRKLNLCKTDRDVLLALSSIYGVDIQADNVLESRRRMLGIVIDWYDDRGIADSLLDKINELLFNNIILGNFVDDKMLYLDNEGYLLDLTSKERIMLLASDAGRFDTMKLLSGENNKYSASDIYYWYKDNNFDIDADFCDEMIRYFQGIKVNRLSGYSWIVSDDCILRGTPEFIVEEEPQPVEAHKVNMDFSADFLNSLNFGG